MKNILNFIIFLLALNVNAQKSNKSILVDKLMTTIEVKKTTQAIIGSVFEQFKIRKPSVPSNVWQEIEKNVDYTDFLKKTKQAYLGTYTEAEIKELIKLYNPKTKEQYTLKSKKIEPKLYAIGNEFGKNIVKDISIKIQGYK